MIEVLFSPECSELIKILELSPDRVVTTINDRHRGLLSDGLDRIVAAHWFSDEHFVLVDSIVTKKEIEKESNRVQFEQVTAQLAIELPSISTDIVTGLVRTLVVR